MQIRLLIVQYKNSYPGEHAPNAHAIITVDLPDDAIDAALYPNQKAIKPTSIS